MPRRLTVLLLAVLGGCAPAVRPPAATLPFEAYALPNGMAVILHEDHSLPLAAVNLWYRVGSGDEPEGRSGFAHLFEHLMFMGTERVPDFDAVMERGGGTNNATTSEDRTNFFSSGPAALLPTLLWLEADRLERLGRDMTQAKLDRQREVVRNERRQTGESRPYGRSELLVNALMYPPGHPYRHPVIGSHEDLEAATLQDVRRFFDTYYAPNNLSLVVAGDFDPKAMKPLIEGLFGDLPRRGAPPRAQAPPAALARAVRCDVPDQVQAARISLVWHSPPFLREGDAEMDLLAAVLASGKSSRLMKRLVYDRALASDVSAWQASQALGSLFSIQATAKPGVDLDRLEAEIDDEIARLLREGPTPDELAREEAAIETRTVSSLQDLPARADRLNTYAFHWGDPGGLERDLDRYRKATPASVRAWGRRVLGPQRLTLRVLPGGEAETPGPRDVRPGDLPSPGFIPPEPETCTLDNGIPVTHWRRSGLPLVSLQLLLRGGAALDPPGKSGLSALTAAMLDEGGGGRGALAFSEALERLGAAFSAGAEPEAFRISLTALRRHWDEALALCADAVLRPRMEEEEWDRAQALHLETLKQALDDPGAVARRVGARAFFGDAHPYGRPPGGTALTVGALTVRDARRCHAERFRPDAAAFVTAGDLTLEELRAGLNAAFGRWKAPPGPPPPPTPCAPAANRSLRVVLVDRPGAVQTVVRFLMPGPRFGDPRRPRFLLLNTVLGGSFSSRLNRNLREAHGYTYGAGSGFAMDPSVGFFVASADVQTDKTGPALGEFLGEFRRLRQGDVSEEEAALARAAYRADTAAAFSSLDGILGTGATLALNRMPPGALADALRDAEACGPGPLNALAAEALPLEQALLVLVGDRRAILPQLEGLGLPAPEELTAEGEPRR